MKPTVIAANQSSPAGGNGNGSAAGAGMNIPINRDYVGTSVHPNSSPHQQQQHYAHQQPHQFYGSQQQPAYGSPRQQQQHQQPPQQHHQQQVPLNQQQQHFQPTFGFEPDMDMDMDNMFPRSRLGRLHHDPFAGFGGSRKRNSLHDPHHPDADFSHYFDDAADFGFPQLSTMGRRSRGANNHTMEHDDDFFNRLPSEFRQYIPEGFGARRSAGPAAQQAYPQTNYQQEYGIPQQQQQHPVPPPQAQAQGQQVPQSPSKRLCDAAIQTEDPAGRSEVDCAPPVNLNQHGLRNTMDMGVKSSAEQEQGPRSHSAPPPEQQQLNQQYQQQHHQQRPTPPPQFGTQTSPPVQQPGQQGQAPQFHKTYYAPQQQAHPQQKQQTPPPPQTPGGSYVRTIPIFVEGRSEPIINAHKEIPNQNAPPAGSQPQATAHAQAQAYAHVPPPQQQHQQQNRPAPLNTQQQPSDQQPQVDSGIGLPPQTPHTVDSIKKIQDIQRDVLELMAKVEQFKGTRQDKEYVYLDEMLTRNLLKLDTIDTNGKDSIRLARKEAIKCIQASVNVLDAKAEENGRIASGVEPEPVAAETTETASEGEAKPAAEEPVTPQPVDATKIQEPIPLPPPPSAAEDAAKPAVSSEPAPETEGTKVEASAVTETSE